MPGGSGNGGQAPEDGTDTEEAERCPICLGVLGRGDLAMPESCCHVFCLSCLLRWAETVPSCPVDRRPFDVVYKRDTVLGCVKVPVKKKVSQSEPERCGCTDMESTGCLLENKQGRLQRQKMEKTSDAKVKGLIRKCNDDDPFAMSKKKVRGALCGPWSLSTADSTLGTLTQGIAEPLWVAEEEPFEASCKQCSRQAQVCPWLSVAVPITARGNSRHCLNPPEWSSSPFPLRPLSTSASSLGLGHFVFQGRVCAVTCPKGGEKKGTGASGSRAPTKQSLTSRRSGRNSRAQEPATTQDPVSSQSHSSDSDSSTNQPTKAGKASSATGKRKGKQAANRKSSGKRKAPARRKASPRVLSSPTGSEEEEESKGEDEKEEKHSKGGEQKENSLELQHSDGEGSPQVGNPSSSHADEEHSSEPSISDLGQEQEKTEIQPGKNENSVSKEQEDEEGEDQKSPLSDAALNSSGLSDDKDQEAVEEHGGPVSDGDMEDLEKSNSPYPSNSPFESPQSLQSGQLVEEDADALEPTADPTKGKLEDDSSMKVSPSPTREQESRSSSLLCDSPDRSMSQQAQGTSEEKASEDAEMRQLHDGTNKRSKDDNLSEDDTDAIPMDCDSPSSEHSNNLTPDPTGESESPDHTAPVSTSQAVEERNSREQECSVAEERGQERRNGKQRRSRFHSSATTWSPNRESRRDSSRRSRSCSQERIKEREGSPPSSRSSRPHSRERDGERDISRKERSRERKSRKRSRSRSRSKSRSPSRSRTRPYRRGASPDRPDSGGQSPRRRDRSAGDGWRAGQGSDSRRNPLGNFPSRETGRSENGGFMDSSPDRVQSDNPDWVTEKTRADAETRSREVGGRWEQQRSGGSADSGARCGAQGGWGGSEHGRGAGRGGYRTGNQQGEPVENRWQPRNTFSGTVNNSGSDSYSRFNENWGGRRKEPEMGESALDRSGWSSASSWAVRRTLPADVQNYYSRRERGAGAGGGGWNRQEEEQPTAAEPPKNESNAQVPGEAPAVLNVVPPQMNVLHYPRGLPVSLQPTPYGMPPRVPLHLYPAVPLLQVPAVATQGLPPPPPPPPPMQQGSLSAAQPDSRATQKQQVQERAINEVKTAMKPYYQKKDITKEEYKEIVRKAVEKICHSKSGEVNSGKVANLVKAYVDKYKHARKK